MSKRSGEKEVRHDELFVRAVQNCYRHYRNLYGDESVWARYAALAACDKYLQEFKLRPEWIDTYYYEDEQLLGLFILKWS